MSAFRAITILLIFSFTNALVCPRTDSIGNYLNYLHLFFQNDDTLFSFSNTNSQVVRMWEKVGAFSAGLGSLVDRMNAFLVKDTSLPQTRYKLYMVWVLMNPDETLSRIVSFACFDVDYANLNGNAFVFKLMNVFFNQNLNSFVFTVPFKHNNANQLCYTRNTVVAPANPWPIFTNSPFYGYPSFSGIVASCIYTSGVLTSIGFNARSAVSGSLPSINTLNPDYIFTPPPAASVPDFTIVPSTAVVFDLISSVKVASIDCNANFIKLEYDNFYYMFSNYYKTGVGKIVPIVPQ